MLEIIVWWLLLQTDKAFNHALDFFKDLYEAIKNKVKYIFIVPGNHDKYRTKENQFLIPAYRTMEMEYNDNEKSKKESKFDNNFYSSFWRFHLEAYRNEKGSGYIELTQQIYI